LYGFAVACCEAVGFGAERVPGWSVYGFVGSECKTVSLGAERVLGWSEYGLWDRRGVSEAAAGAVIFTPAKVA
jgi:hypothetical protein